MRKSISLKLIMREVDVTTDVTNEANFIYIGLGVQMERKTIN
jgi:hypothetical protein